MRSWLKALREQAGLTQEEVAIRVGMSQQSYQMIESGERGKCLKGETAKRIAAVLGFEWTRFFEDDTQAGEVEKR